MVEPITIILFGLLVSGAALVAFWGQVLSWVRQHVSPWVKKHFPDLYPKLERALEAIDKVVVAVRRQIKAAWAALRKRLLKVLVRYEQRGPQWVRVVISWAIKNLQEEQKITKRTESEEVDYDDLPDDVRAQWIRGQGQKETDFTEQRDRELSMMEV